MRTTPPPQSIVLVDPRADVGIVGEPSATVVGRRGPIISRLTTALPTNKSAPAQLMPWRLLVDDHGFPIGDPDGNLIGKSPVFVHRLLFARRTNRMPISRRYSPEFAPGESSIIGLSFDYVIPKGVGVGSGSLKIFTNVASPVDVTASFTVGPVTIAGRTLYAAVSGGVDGTDYQLRWSATDSDGNVWPRTALLLCAQTS